MTSFMYRCPNAGAMVQGFIVVEDIPERFNFESEDGPYKSMYCEMWRQAHLLWSSATFSKCGVWHKGRRLVASAATSRSVGAAALDRSRTS